MIVLKRGFIFTRNGIVKHRKFKCLDRRHSMKKNENRITNTVHNVQLTVRTKRFVFLYFDFLDVCNKTHYMHVQRKINY